MALTLLITIIVAFVSWKTYTALTNPLRHLPGPWISKWTNLRFQWAVMTGERASYEHALHQRYEVSLASISAAKIVYQIGSPYHKPTWYGTATGFGDMALFTIRDPKAHGVRRRLLAHNYSENWIKQMEPYISEKTRVAAKKMVADLDARGYTDVKKWFTFMATDIVSEAAFGESFDTLQSGEKTQYIIDLENDGLRGFIRAELPLLNKLVAYLMFGSANEVSAGLERMKNYAEDRISRYFEAYRADPDHVKPTLMSKAFSAVEDGTLPKVAITSDAMTNIVAGTDTSAITATYAAWYLSQDPDLENALTEEVAMLPQHFTEENLIKLPLLNGVITETLRIRPPVGQGLPRIVPDGGADFEGHFVPGGTTVAIPAYAMHHLPQIWRDADKFDPSRWNDATKDMQSAFLPFGGGSRVCIGQHFAMLEMRHALASFYRTFSQGMRPAWVDGFTADDMKPVSFFVTAPKGQRCLLEV
ncbi:uncharacterized protein MYCFIDRAFT_185345 [Pseudocercospora fijiensis CIRAD86]|uniref:Cytochrome P450 monooxygenase n=1 Tax=Pseudocercospora fijiensis (strain CIRAD86) TaxID=383855 RepID=N1Q7U4_PSEFD|nr:uncharacterized protein MYCFIDRAFT_185345 [Pseudocercospora fijiensis CIRAD86]EME88834.1 hypothetical protein MYCFIDRAFT_185345 [Pseudocercospora fijiensis CIRAD86]